MLHPPLAAALGNMSLDDIAANLTTFALHLSTSDGVVPVASQSPEILGWGRGDPIASAHPNLPGDPGAITQLLAQIDSFVDGTHPRLVLLLGPNFLDRHAWDALLASPSLTGTVDPNANFNLRTPGIDPATVSLNDVTAVADYYTAELADDNSGDVTRIANQLDNIAQRLAVLQPGRSITLVAHSTAGLAARAYAAAHQDRVRALITLAAPHMGAPLPFLTDLATGDGARIANALREAMPASTMRDALDHMVHAMDGYLPAADAATLPQPFPYPAASFNSGAPFDTGSVPVVALQAQLPDDPLAWLKSSTAALAAQVAASARAFPTHLSIAAALPMELPASAGNAILTEAELRLTLLQIPLHDGEPAPAHPKGLRGEIRLSRPEGWLLTGPATGDTRVRDLALRIDLAPALTQVSLELHEAAWHGPTQPVVTTLEPIALQALGEVMRTLTDAQAPLVDALTALTVVVRNASGELGIAADAWTILQNDPRSLIGAHLPDAIASSSGWLGITGPPAGPWTWQPPDSPLTLTITRDTPSGPYRLAIAAQSGGAFELDLSTPVPLLAPEIDAAIHAGIVTVRWSSTTGAVTLEAPPWLASLTVFPPPSPATLSAALNDAWPSLLFSGVLQLVLSTFAPGVRMDRVESFLRDTGAFVFGGLTGDKINLLLQQINQFAGLPAGPGLQLPGDISISAAGGTSAADPIRIDAVTTAPLGGVLGLDLGVHIDSLRHVTPAGSLIPHHAAHQRHLAAHHHRLRRLGKRPVAGHHAGRSLADSDSAHLRRARRTRRRGRGTARRRPQCGGRFLRRAPRLARCAPHRRHRSRNLRSGHEIQSRRDACHARWHLVRHLRYHSTRCGSERARRYRPPGSRIARRRHYLRRSAGLELHHRRVRIRRSASPPVGTKADPLCASRPKTFSRPMRLSAALPSSRWAPRASMRICACKSCWIPSASPPRPRSTSNCSPRLLFASVPAFSLWRSERTTARW